MEESLVSGFTATPDNRVSLIVPRTKGIVSCDKRRAVNARRRPLD